MTPTDTTSDSTPATEPTPTPETTLHPDDGTLLTSLAVTCVECEAKMLRGKKEVLDTPFRPQTRYTYSCADCGTSIFVDVPHLQQG